MRSELIDDACINCINVVEYAELAFLVIVVLQCNSTEIFVGRKISNVNKKN